MDLFTFRLAIRWFRYNPEQVSAHYVVREDGGDPHHHIRDSQYKALAELVGDICRRYNIPVDREHICGHGELNDQTACPGNLDVDKVVELANQLNAPGLPVIPVQCMV